ncbi:hypothetical protein [Nocardia sp. NPDC057227]|uniref:DoxX family protein n=1 Tax=Nocardia sp. NPDC057227 TaxID=3346056 RepID=UPI003638D791
MATTIDPARRPALLLAGGLAGAGVMHFVTPKFFDSIVPPALPGQARTYTYASGVAELAVAGTLLVPRTRGLGGKLAALLFLAVFPANVQMAVDVATNPKASPLFKLGSILRLPLQIPMITTALSVSRKAKG